MVAQKKYSLEFDGVDGYVSIPDDSSLDFGQNDYTVFSWVKLNNLNEDFAIINHMYSSAIDRMNFRINPSNQLHLSMLDNNDNYFTAYTDTIISDSQWHFVAVTFNYSNEIRYFI